MSPDEEAGARWWNSLSEPARVFWLNQAGQHTCIADAWAVYKATKCATTGIPLRFCTCSAHSIRVPS